ncbi:hypothetical protein OIE99_30185 [Streptomyces cellulosae]|nr:hypothetical protein OIE99_30185 [Streptomyces cellulosae]
MADPTQIDPPDSTLSAPSAFGWCPWHHGHTRGIRLIDVIEQGSGSGGTFFACGPCITANGLVPFADR